MDDPDEDNILNFAEFALGTDPLAPNSFGNPFPIIDPYPQPHYQIPFRDAQPDLHYEVFKSDDMITWSTFWDSLTDNPDELQITAGPNGTRLLQLPVLSENETTTFLQLVVNRVDN